MISTQGLVLAMVHGLSVIMYSSSKLCPCIIVADGLQQVVPQEQGCLLSHESHKLCPMHLHMLCRSVAGLGERNSLLIFLNGPFIYPPLSVQPRVSQL